MRVTNQPILDAAAIAGAGRIIAVDMDPFKLGLAKQFGATDVIDARDGDTVKRINELSSGGVHYSFECIGLKATAEQSFSCLRSGGCATLIGMIPVGTQSTEIKVFQLKCAMVS